MGFASAVASQSSPLAVKFVILSFSGSHLGQFSQRSSLSSGSVSLIPRFGGVCLGGPVPVLCPGRFAGGPVAVEFIIRYFGGTVSLAVAPQACSDFEENGSGSVSVGDSHLGGRLAEFAPNHVAIPDLCFSLFRIVY